MFRVFLNFRNMALSILIQKSGQMKNWEYHLTMQTKQDLFDTVNLC